MSGYLIKMNDAFKQGAEATSENRQEVKKDDILFQIDDRPYQAALSKSRPISSWPKHDSRRRTPM